MLRDTFGNKKQILSPETGKSSAGESLDQEVRFRRLRTVHPLPLISSLLQIITGLSVVVLALLGLIIPFGAAAIMSILGSVLTMMGIYQLFDTFKQRNSVEKLASDSINRIIKEQN